MKKTVSVLLVILIISGLLSSCVGREETVQIGSVTVGKGIYEYFLSEAEKTNPDSPEKDAEKMTLRYVAVNTQFEGLGLELNAAQKGEASKTANSYWHLFSDYYTERGISKNDVYFAALSDEYLKAIIRSIYDTDGTNPIPEKAIKDYFSENYVAYKAIIELLQTTDENGNSIDLSDEKINSVTKQFNQMKKSIDGGTSFEKVNAAYQAKGLENEADSEQVMLLSASSKAFPTGTFEEIMKIKRKESGVFTAGKYIFLVERIGEFDDKSFYEQNRDDCLVALGRQALEETLDSWAQAIR
ncbi:MAG: hypothetical protein J5877_01660 [Clostridia bacterium]|nr:hypothetical protein [Clostridia bacterium]